MDVKLLTQPLSINEIDFRIQSISKTGYATILAYKNARIDMQRLDEAVGPMNWKREHTRDNKNCIVSIWDTEKQIWVSKEDTGVESNTEQEKGLASDSFKRACFNWGIGRELYEYPRIFLKLKPEEFVVDGNKCKQTYDLRLDKWTWISEFSEGKLVGLAAKDQNGELRFNYGKFTPKK